MRLGLCLFQGWGEHNGLRRCSVCSSQGKSATAVSALRGGERQADSLCRGARTGRARFCSRGWPEIMPLCPGAATAPTAGPRWRRAPWPRASQRCSLPSGARPLPSPPVPSGPLPEARPRLGLRRKPGHSTRLRDFSFTSCAHPAWTSFCSQLTGCWRGILKLQPFRGDDSIIAKIQYLAAPCCLHCSNGHSHHLSQHLFWCSLPSSVGPHQRLF